MIGRVARFFAATFGRGRFEARLEAELADHLERRVEVLVSSGVPRPEAKRRARLELGGSVDGFKEECRAARRLHFGDELGRNLRQAFRVAKRSPGLTATIALTLGLCLGANAAVLSVIHAVLLAPLPYPQPERLGLVRAVFQPSEGAGGSATSHDGRTWEHLRDGVKGLSVAVSSGWKSGANVLAGDQALYVGVQRVGAGTFEVLGVEPELGRGFTRAEDVPGGPNVVVLSHGLWRRLFGGDPAALGRTLMLKGAPHEIVGVMPEGFRTDVEAELWTPLRPSTRGEGGGTNYQILARLAPGVSWRAANAELRALSSAELPQLRMSNGGHAWFEVVSLQKGLAAGLEGSLLTVWAVAILVLLVGAVNVAGLLIAHGARRAAELATRMALGGGRLVVVRQLLTETLVFSLAGGALGLVFGWLGKHWLSSLARETLGLWQPLRFEPMVVGAVFCLVGFTALLAGVWPAWLATRRPLRPSALGGEGKVAAAGSPWPRRLLVAGQLALVTMLLIGAGLVVRTLFYLRGLAPGCDPEGVMAARVSLEDARYAAPGDVARLLAAFAAELGSRPGIERAAAGLSLPFERPLNMGFALPGDGDRPPGPRITNLTYITPGYFEALAMPLLSGRFLAAADNAAAAPALVVNQAFARAYLGGENAVGRRLSVAGSEREVVGVVGDTLQTLSWGDGAPLKAQPGLFVPVAQVSADFLQLVHTWFAPSVVVRSRLTEAAAEAELRRAVAVVDSALPVAEVRKLSTLREGVIALERFQALLLALAGGIALALGAVGLAGLIANSVVERRKELGVRLALGASLAQTVGRAALPGLLLAGVGVGLGLVLALPLARVLGAFVFGVGTLDPLTFAVVPLLLLTVAAFASLLPALAVTRLDPARTLRVG